MATLTAANAIYLLGAIGIYSTAQQLQGFEVDDAFATDAVVNAQTKMGVDGILSAGWVPMEVKQVITLQADSPSNIIFDTIYTTEQAAQEKSVLFCTIQIPGLGTKYAGLKGFMTSYIPVPDVKRIVQARKFGITWQSLLPAPI
jgi:hypothetical protein